jgi:allantoin racemase
LKQLLLINPNTSRDTTDMMVAIARTCVPADIAVQGVTAACGAAVITTPQALAAAAIEVVEIGRRKAGEVSGMVVGAFGDPGLEALRERLSIPVVGICEASMLEAAAGARRFGVATTTPELAAAIEDRARDLDLLAQYVGIRLTPGDPVALMADPARLHEALADAVARSFEDDHAQAVIIGGGPLGQAALSLAARFKQPIIAPIPAAMRRMLALMNDGNV